MSEQQGESAHWLPSLWNEGNYGGKGQVKPTAASTQDNSEANAIVHLLEAFQGLERRRGMVSTKSPSTCPRGSCSKQMDAGDGSGRLSVTRWGHQTHLFTWRCLIDWARWCSPCNVSGHADVQLFIWQTLFSLYLSAETSCSSFLLVGRSSVHLHCPASGAYQLCRLCHHLVCRDLDRLSGHEEAHWSIPLVILCSLDPRSKKWQPL